ncbi:MAG: hypothetical protein P0120_03210 [Nitrospira sp.]|nr:hypothetical protein [Nitrospira sp.]
MRRGGYWRAVVVLWLMVPLSDFQPVYAAADAGLNGTNGLEMICLTERPVIVQGETVRLRVWASTSDGQSIAQPLTFQWQVTEGHIQGTGNEVRWDLSAVTIEPSEPYKNVVATVTANAPSVGNGRCSVRVTIKEPVQTRGPLISTRGFLKPKMREKPGYGLYSYLLFSAPPQHEGEKARYLKVLEACLSIMRESEEFLDRQPDSELNATYIPVRKTPMSGKSDSEWAEKVLAVYDYAAAQILLSKLDTMYQQGPYLISTLKPLSMSDSPQPLHLFQDLTGVVPDQASNWVKHFTYLVAQQRSWQDQSLRQFHLKMRNLLAVAGIVTPEVVNAVKTLVQVR